MAKFLYKRQKLSAGYKRVFPSECLCSSAVGQQGSAVGQ